MQIEIQIIQMYESCFVIEIEDTKSYIQLYMEIIEGVKLFSMKFNIGI